MMNAASLPRLRKYTRWRRNSFGQVRSPHPFGEARQVVGDVAEQVLDDHAAAEIMTDRIFLGHADPAMQLDCVLRDEFARLPDADLRHRDVVGALDGIGLLD